MFCYKAMLKLPTGSGTSRPTLTRQTWSNNRYSQVHERTGGQRLAPSRAYISCHRETRQIMLSGTYAHHSHHVSNLLSFVF